MEDTIKWEDLLDLLDRPAFTVSHGKILRANEGALARLLPEGQEIEPLLTTGKEAYAQLGEGSLCLTLNIADRLRGAAVHRIRENLDLFLLDQDADIEALRALALAAQKLRGPLSTLIHASEQLFPELELKEAPQLQRQSSLIHQSSYQLLRIIGNMSDAEQYLLGPVGYFEPTELGAFFGEIFEKCRFLMEGMEVKLDFRPLPAPKYLGIDRAKMERAVYNLLSNALRFTPKGGTIQAWLTLSGKAVILHIRDSGEGFHQAFQRTLFLRYQREPAVEDGRFGLGLGLLLVRQIAALHNGSIVVGPGPEGGTEIALSMEEREMPVSGLRSPIWTVDYSGSRDHALVELSGELPPEYYVY